MAIARDSSSRNGNAPSTSPISWAHTCAGSDRYLVVAVGDETGDGVSAVTYNGVAMTQLKKVNVAGGIWLYFYGLVAPATGSNTIAVTNTAGHNMYGFAVSYTGVKQTGQPDASVSNQASDDPHTTTLTTIEDNCWLVLVNRSAENGTASTGSTFVQAFNGTDTKDRGLYDSGAARTPAGSQSMVLDYSGANVLATLMVSLSPAAVAAPQGAMMSLL